MSHRSPLPRRRDQRRLPLPAGSRGGGSRRSDRLRRHRSRTRRLRDPQLAGGVRRLPRLPARPAAVLLRDPQRDPEDDPARRHRALAGTRYRCVLRQDARRRRAVHEGRRRCAGDGRRPARLRGDGRARRDPQHRWSHPRPVGRGVRVRGCRGHGNRRGSTCRRLDDHRYRHRRPQARVGLRVRGDSHLQLDDQRPGRVRPFGDRRIRRRRVHRSDRPAGGLPAGVLRPRPSLAPWSSSGCRTPR